MTAPDAPAGVYLRPPSGKPIACVLVHRGEQVQDGKVLDVWEAMPEVTPHGFGQEPGWRVTVAVLPAHTTIRLCLPDDFDLGRMYVPPAYEGPT